LIRSRARWCPAARPSWIMALLWPSCKSLVMATRGRRCRAASPLPEGDQKFLILPARQLILTQGREVEINIGLAPHGVDACQATNHGTAAAGRHRCLG